MDKMDKRINKQVEVIAKFEHLWIWKESHELMLECHKIVNTLPYPERSKGDQLRRSSGSPPDNIAECVGSYYYNDKIKCLSVARKESMETQNHLIALRDRGFISVEKAKELVGRYGRLIIGINSYKKKIIESRTKYNKLRRKN